MEITSEQIRTALESNPTLPGDPALAMLGTGATEAADRTGKAGPMNKVLWAELHQDIAELTMGLLGRDALDYPCGYAMSRAEGATSADEFPQYAYLRSRAVSIEGGTSEILRTVIGERILGLEPEPRIDKRIAWRETRRG